MALKDLPSKSLSHTPVRKNSGEPVIEISPTQAAKIFVGLKIKPDRARAETLVAYHAIEGVFEPKITSLTVNTNFRRQIPNLKNHGIDAMNIF
jgi:hypothetical protein